MILEGRISLNGKILNSLGVKVDPTHAQVSVDGKPLSKLHAPKVYWMFHKAANTLCVLPKPDDERETIYHANGLKDLSFHVSAAGRLDFKGEGLLLLSNDESFVNDFSDPKKVYARHYGVLSTDKLTDDQLSEIRRGINLADGMTKNVEITYAHGKNLGASRGSWYFVTIYEGRNRLVQRIFEHFEQRVIKLVRYGLGDFRIPEDLRFGDYRQLSIEELTYLRKLVGSKS